MGARRIVDWRSVSADRWTIIFPYGHAYDDTRLIAGLTVLFNQAPIDSNGHGYIWQNVNALPGESKARASVDRDLGSGDMIVRFSQGERMAEICKVVRCWRDGK